MNTFIPQWPYVQTYPQTLKNSRWKELILAQNWRLTAINSGCVRWACITEGSRKGVDDCCLEGTIWHLNSYCLSFCPASDVWMIHGSGHPAELVNNTTSWNATERQWETVILVMEWLHERSGAGRARGWFLKFNITRSAVLDENSERSRIF